MHTLVRRSASERAVAHTDGLDVLLTVFLYDHGDGFVTGGPGIGAVVAELRYASDGNGPSLAEIQLCLGNGKNIFPEFGTDLNIFGERNGKDGT